MRSPLVLRENGRIQCIREEKTLTRLPESALSDLAGRLRHAHQMLDNWGRSWAVTPMLRAAAWEPGTPEDLRRWLAEELRENRGSLEERREIRHHREC